MILLPRIRRSYLSSFSLTVGLGTSALLGVGLFAFRLDSEEALAFVFIPAVAVSLPGIFWPQIMTKPYKLWNMAARSFARGARILILGVCFYVMLLAVGRAGASMAVARPDCDKSLWNSKKTLPRSTYFCEHAASGPTVTDGGWIHRYFCWTKASGHFWALCLLPFLIMLAAVEIYQDQRFPSNIYTLF